METKKLLVGGVGVEFQHFANRVIDGYRILTPTTASSQATGAGAYAVRANIDWGILAVGSQVKEVAAQADVSIESGTGVLVLNEWKVYDIVNYLSRGDNVIYQKVFGGTKNTTQALALAGIQTDAQIEAAFAPNTAWMKVGRVIVNRSADTVLTVTFDNTIRNTLVPGTVHYGVNPLA